MATRGDDSRHVFGGCGIAERSGRQTRSGADAASPGSKYSRSRRPRPPN